MILRWYEIRFGYKIIMFGVLKLLEDRFSKVYYLVSVRWLYE